MFSVGEVCKPLYTPDGGTARQMALVFNDEGLDKLSSPPIVAQQFVNHNSRLFKVFVVGDYVCVRPRPSIRNLLPSDDPTIFFASDTISKENSRSPLTMTEEQTNGINQLHPDEHDLLVHIAQRLRVDLRVDLFGFDVIRCASGPLEPTISLGDCTDDPDVLRSAKFAVIDVNSVPGYQSVPYFLEHLENLIRQKLSLPPLPVPTDDQTMRD